MEKFELKRDFPNKGKELVIEEINECHVCTSHKPNLDGYIRVFVGKDISPRCQFLHRLVWKHYKGEIPDQYEIDHKCRNRACCNVDHLQLLGKSEHKSKGNLLRYRDRIDKVIQLIKDGKSNKEIKLELNVEYVYTNRYRRNLKKEKYE